jgi:hypothetical protein
MIVETCRRPRGKLSPIAGRNRRISTTITATSTPKTHLILE